MQRLKSNLVSPTEDSISVYGQNKGNEIAAEHFTNIIDSALNEHLEIIAGDTKKPLVTIRGGGLATFEKRSKYYINSNTSYNDMKGMDKIIQENAARSRGRCPGRGDVRMLGIRYDYAESPKKQKLVYCKRHKECSEMKHEGAINMLQRITNAGIIVARG